MEQVSHSLNLYEMESSAPIDPLQFKEECLDCSFLHKTYIFYPIKHTLFHTQTKPHFIFNPDNIVL